MDSMDAATKLQKEFGSAFVQWSDARKAVELEAEDFLEESKRKDYSGSIDHGYGRVRNWILTATEYSITLSWLDMARFTSSHRPACVWAVLVGNAIAESKETATTEVQP